MKKIALLTLLLLSFASWAQVDADDAEVATQDLAGQDLYSQRQEDMAYPASEEAPEEVNIQEDNYDDSLTEYEN